MDKFWFIYRDSLGNWNTAENPRFIAEHTMCRAIDKVEGEDHKRIGDIVARLNDYNRNEDKEILDLMRKFDIT